MLVKHKKNVQKVKSIIEDLEDSLENKKLTDEERKIISAELRKRKKSF